MTAREASAIDPQPILDASCVLLVDTSGAEPALLMGLRQASNVFLPNKWVFPGGRLEAGDALIAPADALCARDASALAARLPQDVAPAFAQSLAVAAIRELYEETGHALGVAAPDAGATACSTWLQFAELGLRPSVAPLRFIARAITPPFRPRRYDTRFFVANRADVVEGAGPADGEFADLNWFTLPEVKTLDLPVITRRVLADFESHLADSAGHSVPFYYEENGISRRDLIAPCAGLV